MCKFDVFYIDPQSYGNLALYDYSLLKGNKSLSVLFVGSYLYSQKEISLVEFIPLFHYNKLNYKICKSISYLFSLLRLLLLIQRYKPRVIHVQWMKLPIIDFYYYKLVKFFFNSSIIYTVHNVLPHDTGSTRKKRYLNLYKLVDKIIVHTNSSKVELCRDFNIDSKKINVIPHGLLYYDLKNDVVEECKREIVEKYQLKNKCIFSLLGNQNLYKGSDIVADVWRHTTELCESGKCALLVFGKISNVDFTELMKCKNVYIENRILSDEEFVALLELTDVLLMPYRCISQSGLLLSAMSTQTPVLVSNVGGLIEPFDVAEVGWIVNELSFSSLRHKMIELLRSPKEIERIKYEQTNWNNVKSYYDWNAIYRKTTQLYKL